MKLERRHRQCLKRQCFQYAFVLLYFFNVFLNKIADGVRNLGLSQLTANKGVSH